MDSISGTAAAHFLSNFTSCCDEINIPTGIVYGIIDDSWQNKNTKMIANEPKKNEGFLEGPCAR